MVKEDLKEELENLKGENDLKDYVIDYILDQEDIEDFIKDVVSHGCISGVVGGLIYYYDTRAFYDKYYYEIEEMRENWEDETGEHLHPDGDLKNWFAWFAFENTCYQLGNELNNFKEENIMRKSIQELVSEKIDIGRLQDKIIERLDVDYMVSKIVDGLDYDELADDVCDKISERISDKVIEDCYTTIKDQIIEELDIDDLADKLFE
jgi:hypothetical protein